MSQFIYVNSEGLIINRVVADKIEDCAPPEGISVFQEPEEQPMNIGGTFIEGEYTPPYSPNEVPPTMVPSPASKLGLKRALDEIGMWSQVKAAIASDENVQEEWNLAVEIRRTDPLVQMMIDSMSLTEEQVDNILIRANELVS